MVAAMAADYLSAQKFSSSSSSSERKGFGDDDDDDDGRRFKKRGLRATDRDD